MNLFKFMYEFEGKVTLDATSISDEVRDELLNLKEEFINKPNREMK